MQPLRPSEDEDTRRTFCTQIIPESHDTARFQRFKQLVSVYFEKKYDALLDSTSPKHPDSMDVDNAADTGFPPFHGPLSTTSKRKGHYYAAPTNVLQTSRNAILMSEKWMRWFDEGRFILHESGGQVSSDQLCFPVTYFAAPVSRPMHGSLTRE